MDLNNIKNIEELLEEDCRVVILSGVSGSGKTYLSRKLEEKGYIRLSSDRMIWELYGPDFEGFPREKQHEIFLRTDERIASMLPGLLADGKGVVIDSAMCKRFKRDRIREICRKSGTEAVTIYLYVPAGLLLSRLAERKGDGPDDQIVTESQLLSFLANFEKPGEDEPHIVIRSY